MSHIEYDLDAPGSNQRFDTGINGQLRDQIIFRRRENRFTDRL